MSASTLINGQMPGGWLQPPGSANYRTGNCEQTIILASFGTGMIAARVNTGKYERYIPVTVCRLRP